MDRKIKLTFPELNISVRARLLEEEEPEMCDYLWNSLSQPLKNACVHTLSTGEFVMARCRPPREALKTGTQDHPLGRTQSKLGERKPGEISFTGLMFELVYGANITEPLEGCAGVCAQVVDEDLEAFYRAGRGVWASHVKTHELVTMLVQREEG
mgnify:CR=1 FL=1